MKPTYIGTEERIRERHQQITIAVLALTTLFLLVATIYYYYRYHQLLDVWETILRVG